jgi:hypothetical protein
VGLNKNGFYTTNKKNKSRVCYDNPSSYYDNFIRDNFVRGKEKKVGQFKSLLSFTFFLFSFFLSLGLLPLGPLAAPLLVTLSSRYSS